jgi:hypothetical protein
MKAYLADGRKKFTNMSNCGHPGTITERTFLEIIVDGLGEKETQYVNGNAPGKYCVLAAIVKQAIKESKSWDHIKSLMESGDMDVAKDSGVDAEGEKKDAAALITRNNGAETINGKPISKQERALIIKHRKNGGANEKIKCYNCGRRGHRIAECFRPGGGAHRKSSRSPSPSRSPPRKSGHKRKHQQSTPPRRNNKKAKKNRYFRENTPDSDTEDNVFVTTTSSASETKTTLPKIVVSCIAWWAVILCVLTLVVDDTATFSPAMWLSAALCPLGTLSGITDSCTKPRINVRELGLTTDVASVGATLIFDGGATTHVIHEAWLAEMMTNTRLVTSQVIYMNAHPEKIVMRGDLKLKVKDAKSGKVRNLTLYNVAYVPTSKYALVSETVYLDNHRVEGGNEATIVHTRTDFFIQSATGKKLHGRRDGGLYKLDIAEKVAIAAPTTVEKAGTIDEPSS